MQRSAGFGSAFFYIGWSSVCALCRVAVGLLCRAGGARPKSNGMATRQTPCQFKSNTASHADRP